MTGERLDGFQLWVNLPAEHKMTAPRYRGVLARDVPVVNRKDGVTVRVIGRCSRWHQGGCEWNLRESRLSRRVDVCRGSLRAARSERAQRLHLLIRR